MSQHMPFSEDAVAAVLEHAHRLANPRPLLDGVGHLQQMAFVTHDADHLDPFEAVDPLRQVDRLAARADTDAVEADIHLDDYAARNPLLPAGGRQRLDLRVMVAGDNRVGRAAERDHAFELPRADDHVGDEQIANAGPGHHLGFGDFRARHADGAGRDLRQRDRRRLVALHVGPPLLAPRRDEVGHLAKVRLHHLAIDAEDRRVEIEFIAANQRLGHNASSGLSSLLQRER